MNKNFLSRLLKIRDLIQSENLNGILVSDSSNIQYLTGYKGFSNIEREAYFLVTTDNYYLLTDDRYTLELEQYIEKQNILRLTRNFTLKHHLHKIFNQQVVSVLGFEDEQLSVSEYNNIKFTNIKLVPLSLEEIRLLKDEDELLSIKKACEITDIAFSQIRKHIKENITEAKLAYILESIIREYDATLSFSSIVAFAKNSATPHHLTDTTKLIKNDVILFDFGVNYNGYCSDMSRTIIFGEPTNEFINNYNLVLNAQNRAISHIEKLLKDKNDFIPVKELDIIAKEVFKSNNSSVYSHALGHGIGMKVHESPILSELSDEVLVEDIVFTLEPGLYIKNKYGIRIEDMFIIKKKRLLKLTKSTNSIISV